MKMEQVKIAKDLIYHLMTLEQADAKRLRVAIIGLTKRFLHDLESGTSEETLTSILSDIRNKELQLIKEEGSMLYPAIWKLLHNRLMRRKNTD